MWIDSAWCDGSCMEEDSLDMQSLPGEMEGEREKQRGRAKESGGRCGRAPVTLDRSDALLCAELVVSDAEDFTARLVKVNTSANAHLGKR